MRHLKAQQFTNCTQGDEQIGTGAAQTGSLWSKRNFKTMNNKFAWQESCSHVLWSKAIHLPSLKPTEDWNVASNQRWIKWAEQATLPYKSALAKNANTALNLGRNSWNVRSSTLSVLTAHEKLWNVYMAKTKTYKLCRVIEASKHTNIIIQPCASLHIMEIKKSK